jgi:hypothetical protein
MQSGFLSKKVCFLFVALLLGGMRLAVEAVPSPGSDAPYHLSGFVNLLPVENKMVLAVVVRQNNQLVPKLKVKLMGNPTLEITPGKYLANDVAFTPVPGNAVQVTFDHLVPAQNLHFMISRLTAQATISDLVTITSPRRDHGGLPLHANTLQAGPLIVEWMGGTPPYWVQIISGVTLVYSEKKVFGKTLSIPSNVFSSRKEYQVVVHSSSNMNYDKEVDPSSSFVLMLTDYVNIIW